MILYHFTAISLLDAILREGLTRGELPFSREHVGRAIWFTTDPSPSGHGLTDGGQVPPAALAQVERETGRKFPDGLRWPDKRRVRIEVVIPSRDRKLKSWLPFARKNLKREWMDELTEIGGGKAKAETWYIYPETVPPTMFRAIHIRSAGGVFLPMTEADRDEARRDAAEME